MQPDLVFVLADLLLLRCFANGGLEFNASMHRSVSFKACARSSEPRFNWNIALRSPSKVVHHRARYLVDCLGRRAVLSKMFDMPIIENEDRLFAYAQWFSSSIKYDDCFTRIEAVKNGWWYTNRAPRDDNKENKRLVVFYADKDLPGGKKSGEPRGV